MTKPEHQKYKDMLKILGGFEPSTIEQASLEIHYDYIDAFDSFRVCKSLPTGKKRYVLTAHVFEPVKSNQGGQHAVRRQTQRNRSAHRRGNREDGERGV